MPMQGVARCTYWDLPQPCNHGPSRSVVGVKSGLQSINKKVKLHQRKLTLWTTRSMLYIYSTYASTGGVKWVVALPVLHTCQEDPSGNVVE